VLSLAGSAVMYFKNKFKRVRPWVLANLSPPIPLPGHPAYPSGHSTQMHLMAYLLAELVPDPAGLDDIALDVAVNRERAGLHYPSDTAAGKKLAGKLFKILKHECPTFERTLEAARAEWPPRQGVAKKTLEVSPPEQLGRLRDTTAAFLDREPLAESIQARAQDLAPRNPPCCAFTTTRRAIHP
jgi:hypothetical protein